MAKKKRTMVAVPKATLSALKSLLYSPEGGVDLSTIVADLSIDKGGEDLAAINVGLAYKGIKPEVDQETRYGWGYYNFEEYIFEHYSLILDQVRYKVVHYAFDGKTNSIDTNKPEEMGCRVCTYSDWEEMSTNREEVMEKLIKQYGTAPQTV